MKLSLLDTTHPTYNAPRWARVSALSTGGEDFKEHISEFMQRNPAEPPDMYAQRLQQSHYTNYVGSIISLYTAWLFSTSFSVKAYARDTETPVAVDAFYGQFQEDVGNEVSLVSFMQERFRSTLTNQKSYWLIELPSDDGNAPSDLGEYQDRGLGRATLKAIERHEVYDYEEDEHGALVWCVLHTCYDTRESWMSARDTTVETWRVYDREMVHTFQMKYQTGQRPREGNHEVPNLGSAPHGFKRVPIVRMEVPVGMCIGEQTYDAQLEHFRLDNALSWLIRRTCFAQPILNLEDSEGAPPRLGTGYAVILGVDEKFGWTSPPVAPFDVLGKTVSAKRDEIYRVTHTMAASVDNNAETVGRSAASKEIDAASTRILLNAYGALVCHPIEETLEIISESRGDLGTEWSLEGFSGIDTATLGSLLANAQAIRNIGIPSETLYKELGVKISLASLPEADQRVKDIIRQEIHSAKFDIATESTAATLEKAKAELDIAKAKAEPIKADAAVTASKQPKTPAAAPPPKV